MLVAVFAVLFAWATFMIGRPIVRYLQDPKGLRRYPCQNLLSGISALAYGWEVGRSHRLFHTQRLHEQLVKNPVVRVGPNWLSFGRAAAAKDIYGFSSPCNKGGIYHSLQGGVGESLILTLDRGFHSVRRRMVANSYAPNKIELWEPRVADSTRVLVSKLDAMCTTAPTKPLTGVIPQEELTFNAEPWSMLYGFECAIKIGLSLDPGFLAQGSDIVEVTRPDGRKENARVIDCMHSSSRAASSLVWDTANFPLLKKMTAKFSPWYASQWHNASNWGIFIEQITRERLELSDTGEDFEDLTQLMIRDRKGEEAEISHIDRITEVHQIVNGGGDGPAISLINTLYYLLKHPETMAKLRAELDASLTPEDTVAPWSKVKKMPYLRACIDESMRLSPPVATDLLRTTPPDRPCTIAGEVVPPNTNVSISAYTAHRDPDIFPEPEAFIPERWLKTGDDRLRRMLEVYIPFSAGSRACIGRSVALLMQVIYIATVLYRYDFALPSPDWEMKWVDYFNLWPVELPLKIWRRRVDKLSA